MRNIPQLHAIRSERIVTPEGVRPGIITIRNGKILGIGTDDGSRAADHCWDAGQLAVIPGLIDIHVHINEPGRTEWEGVETATRAAAAGGCTCLVDMPLNCIPSTATVQALEQKRQAFRERSQVDFAFWGAVVPGNVQHIRALAEAGAKGFKCFLTPSGTAEFEMVSEADLRRAMPEIAATGLPLLAHAELPAPIAAATSRLESEAADWRHYATYLASRPVAAELLAIRLLIRLCREYRCPTHIVHLSAAEALPELQAARQEGLPLTVETCPHYLFFFAESIPHGATAFKCAPPIRNAVNRELLWQGLREGIIDLIATDHSPCPPEMKCPEQGSFQNAWGGISSLSVALSAVWTEAQRRGFSLSNVVRWMSESPAQLAGIANRKGRITPGYDADLVIFDPESETVVREDRLYFRHPWTPYLKARLQGSVEATVVRGQLAFSRGDFPAPPSGQEVTAQANRSRG